MPDPGRRAPAVTLGDDFTEDPYPRLAAWREVGELPRVRLPYGVSALLVTRHPDAVRVLTSPSVSKDVRPALHLLARGSQDRGVVSAHMLNADPPEHARLRRLAAPALGHPPPGGWAEVIRSLTIERLDAMAPAGHGDLITDLALPLPVTLICRMLGVPAADQDRVMAWSNEMVLQASPASVTRAGEALAGYLAELIDRGGGGGLSRLVGPGHGGDRLSRTELISTAFLLLFAGHETTVNLIGNGALALLRHPDQLDRLRRNRAGWPAAVEELMRYDSPVAHATIRYTTGPVTVAGRTVPRGRFLLVSLAAANRDPRAFADPDRLDVGRAAAGHLAFGAGAHRCLGARLGRLQGRIALRELVERFPRLRLAVPPGELRHRPSTLMRGLESLPVRWD